MIQKDRHKETFEFVIAIRKAFDRKMVGKCVLLNRYGRTVYFMQEAILFRDSNHLQMLCIVYYIPSWCLGVCNHRPSLQHSGRTCSLPFEAGSRSHHKPSVSCAEEEQANRVWSQPRTRQVGDRENRNTDEASAGYRTILSDHRFNLRTSVIYILTGQLFCKRILQHLVYLICSNWLILS